MPPRTRRPRLNLHTLEGRTVPSVYPVGPEVHVSPLTALHRRNVAVAADAAGDFVAVWDSYGQDGAGYEVYAQRFSAAGLPQGPEFRVHTDTSGNQTVPAVAVDADGDFVVAWQNWNPNGTSDDIHARRFSAAGVGQGTEFRVNTTTDAEQTAPAVAVDADGDFVVAWESYVQEGTGFEVVAQRYTAAGLPAGGEFRVNTTTDRDELAPAVGMAAGGEFVIVWEKGSYPQGIGNAVFAQRFSAAGLFVGDEFRVNTTTGGARQTPAIGMAAGGEFVVAWEGGDGSLSGIDAQRYSAAGVAQGTEFRVNTTTASEQREPAVGTAAGGFVVAWQTYGQDGDGYGIYAQRYAAAGAAQGGEFRVNTRVGRDQHFPAVAMDATGDFVVGWDSTGSYDALVQRYTAAGVAEGGEVILGPAPAGNRTTPAMASDAAGNYVVAWTGGYGQDGSGYGIYAQRYSAAGVPRGAEFRVNTFAPGDQRAPAVAMDADGDFIVTWQSSNQDGSADGIYAQRYSAAGVPQEAEFRVNTTTFDFQQAPAVAMDADGDFVVAWQSNLQDGAQHGIYAQRYSAGGVPRGGEFRVNATTANDQRAPAVALDSDGDFVVAWQSYASGAAGFDIHAQRYSAAGVMRGIEFRVNSYTNGLQTDPSVAIDTDGDFVVAWQGVQEALGYGVYFQRFSALGAARGFETPADAADLDGQAAPAVRMAADGTFVLAWQDYAGDQTRWEVHARLFDPAGDPHGDGFRVSTTVANDQTAPAVAMDADGDFVVAWAGKFETGGATGIYSQRYENNRPPTALLLTNATVPEGEVPPTPVGQFYFTDGDLDEVLTYALAAGDGDTDNALFAIDGFDLSALVTFDFETRSDYSVLVRGTDLGGNTIERAFAIGVRNVNEAPVLLDDAELYPVLQGTTNPPGRKIASLFAGLVADPDPDAALGGLAVVGNPQLAAQGTWQYSTDAEATWFAVGGVAEGPTALALAADTRLRFLPAAEFSGTPGGLTVRALDDTFGGPFTSGGARETTDTSVGEGSSARSPNTAAAVTTIFPLGGTGGNTPPTLSGVPISANLNEGQTLSFTAAATDPDVGQALTFGLDGAPAGASIDPDTGAFAWTPTEAQGPDTLVFEVQVSDGLATTAQTVTAVVREVNQAPVLAGVPTNRITVRGVPVLFAATATDDDELNGQGNALTYSLVNAPPGAGIDPDTGAFRWVPGGDVDAGTYTFSVRVADDGVPAASHTAAITIAVADAAVVGGNLLVGGTNANDSIGVKPSKDKLGLVLTMNKAVLGTYPLSAIIGRVVAHGLGGNDKLTVNAKVPTGADLYGEAGNDSLTGGAGPDVLVGGSGNDKLAGRAGANVLLGGAGADRLTGGSGDDLLVGGPTIFDVDPTGLAAVRAEWSAPLPYADRVIELTVGGGLNGAVILGPTTVGDDLVKDVLTGGKGFDWFVASALDSLDLKPGEQKMPV